MELKADPITHQSLKPGHPGSSASNRAWLVTALANLRITAHGLHAKWKHVCDRLVMDRLIGRGREGKGAGGKGREGGLGLGLT